jgi:hypothetical protein
VLLYCDELSVEGGEGGSLPTTELPNTMTVETVSQPVFGAVNAC